MKIFFLFLLLIFISISPAFAGESWIEKKEKTQWIEKKEKTQWIEKKEKTQWIEKKEKTQWINKKTQWISLKNKNNDLVFISLLPLAFLILYMKRNL